MALLDDIPAGALVGLDTSPFIYFMEAHSLYGPLVRPFFELRLDQGLNRAVTSVVSLAEVLSKPLTAGRTDLVQAHRDYLTKSPNLQLAPVTVAAAERAAYLRSQYGLKTPDALQVAVALEQGASLFITNDVKLRKVTELTVVMLLDYLPPSTP